MDQNALHNLKDRLLDTAILGMDTAFGDGRLQRAVESFAAGTVLAVLVAPGDDVDAGTVLAAIGKPGESYGAVPVAQGEQSATPAAEAPAPEKVKTEQPEYLPIIKGQPPMAAPAAPARQPACPAMPNAKLLARERGVDLAQVTASNGQFIKRQDVLAYTPAVAGDPAEYDVMPMSRMRQTIAKRMRQSADEIPVWQCNISVDMAGCMALRETFKQKKDVKLSYNDIMAKAIAVASRKFPLVNARYEEGEVRIFRHTNVGLAVGLDSGLVVPVVKGIDVKGLEEIAADYKAAIAKAREGKLTPADMGCGSITISNLGMYDVDHFIAIVNPPESCILAVGSIRVEPVWNGKEFLPVHKMSITGSFDHRIIDGAYGAQFLRELKALMENPALMLY